MVAKHIKILASISTLVWRPLDEGDRMAFCDAPEDTLIADADDQGVLALAFMDEGKLRVEVYDEGGQDAAAIISLEINDDRSSIFPWSRSGQRTDDEPQDEYEPGERARRNDPDNRIRNAGCGCEGPCAHEGGPDEPSADELAASEAHENHDDRHMNLGCRFCWPDLKLSLMDRVRDLVHDHGWNPDRDGGIVELALAAVKLGAEIGHGGK